ncbi:hypothetical protein LCGC14_1210820, partial [marine sediment metagenome]
LKASLNLLEKAININKEIRRSDEETDISS